MFTQDQHEKAMSVLNVLDKAVEKANAICESPYYRVFSNENERARDLIQINKVILRVQSYYINQFCKNLYK
jgi:hypothetical protein